METKQTFLQISPEECLRIYPEIEKNAAEFFQTGQLLANAGYYGKAVSHLILGTEEYIKSFCLFLEGKNFQLRKIKGTKRIFTNHASRHNIIRESYSFWMVAKHFFTPAKLSKSGLIKSALHALLTLLPAIGNHDWWAKADFLKQKGLYADYQNKLLLPSHLTEEDYKETLRFTQPIQKEINEMTQRVNGMTPKELKNFQVLFREAELDLLIAETIQPIS